MVHDPTSLRYMGIGLLGNEMSVGDDDLLRCRIRQRLIHGRIHACSRGTARKTISFLLLHHGGYRESYSNVSCKNILSVRILTPVPPSSERQASETTIEPATLPHYHSDYEPV